MVHTGQTVAMISESNPAFKIPAKPPPFVRKPPQSPPTLESKEVVLPPTPRIQKIAKDFPTLNQPDVSEKDNMLELTQGNQPILENAVEQISDRRTTRRKMNLLRHKIADRLLQVQRNAAILTMFNEVDMSTVINTQKSFQERFVKKHGVKLSFTSFFAKASVHALQAIPSLNARIEEDDRC